MQYLPHGWAVTVYDLASKTNLGPATHAVVWGRNDDGGRAWADAVADAITIPSVTVRLQKLPAHWHLDNPLPPGRTKEQLTAYLKNVIAKATVKAPAPQPTTPPQPTPTNTSPLNVNTNLPFLRSGARNDGAIRPVLENAALLLDANLHIWDLRYNEFASRPTIAGNYLNDADTYKIGRWVQRHGVSASLSTITEAIMAVATQRTFHPVKEYLDPLVWDNHQRLDHIFIDHAGAPDTPLIRAFSSKWFIQAIARIYEPGCQADGTLVLEGVQGLRKSTFFRELFGDMWFTDHLPDITNKDALLQLRGVWCVEIGELATLGRAESAKIKQFLTSRIDRYRDPFGRMVADYPRTCVFAGSINPGAGGYLKDETGARRFWPMPVNERIDTNIISATRDQYWAEALHRYRNGERWFLDSDDLIAEAANATDERFVSDPWQDKIEAYLSECDEVTMAQIFGAALQMPDVAKWSPIDMSRVSRCLAVARWTRIRRGNGSGHQWVYRPTASATARRKTVEPWPDVQDPRPGFFDNQN